MTQEPLLAVGRPDFFFFYMFSCAGCVISDFMHSHIYPVSVESDFLTVAPSNLVAVYFMYCSE